MLRLCGYQSCLHGKRALSSLDATPRMQISSYAESYFPRMLRLRPRAVYNLPQKVHKGREEKRDNIIRVKNVSSGASTSGESRGGHIRINKAEGAPRTCKESPSASAASMKY